VTQIIDSVDGEVSQQFNYIISGNGH